MKDEHETACNTYDLTSTGFYHMHQTFSAAYEIDGFGGSESITAFNNCRGGEEESNSFFDKVTSFTTCPSTLDIFYCLYCQNKCQFYR